MVIEKSPRILEESLIYDEIEIGLIGPKPKEIGLGPIRGGEL